jgi:hypothetical protein
VSYGDKPCPNCGHCPTCGRSNAPYGVWPPYRWTYPYPYQWHYTTVSPTTTGASGFDVTTFSDSTPSFVSGSN